MKIVHITNYFMPDLGYQEYYLSKYHAEMGHEVHIITSDKAYPKHSDYLVFKDIFPNRQTPTGEFLLEGFTVHRLHSRFEFNMQLFLAGITKMIVTLSPDIIFLHGFTRVEMIHISLWKKLSHKSFTLIVDDHMQMSAYVEKGYRRIYYGIFKFLIRYFGLIDAIDKVVAISAETKQYLQSFFPIPDNKISIINLGVDRDKFIFSPSARVFQREKLGIPNNAFLIIYAGKIIPSKKCDLVYEIAREYLQTNPNVFLLFVGSGVESEYAQNIKQLIKTDGVENKIIWHSHIPHDELPQLFSAADVAIWPYQETMAALEAASCSLPIILRNSKIALEYVAYGNGFACSSLEEQKMALGKLIASPSMQHDMGENGREAIANKYDWRMVAKMFLSICNER